MNILKKVGIALGYVLFFALCTVLFVRFLFPTKQAKEFAALKLAEATGAETVTIRDLGIRGLIPSGVSLEGLEMTLPGVKKKTTERNGSVIGDKRHVVIEELVADVGSISGLTNGAPDVTFDVKMGGGTIKGGHYSREKGGPHVIKIEKIERVTLGPEQLFQSLVGIDIQGVFSGSVDLDIPTEVRDGKDTMLFDEMAGTVDLTLANAVALEPIIEVAGAREKLTDLDLGEVHVKLVAEPNTTATPGGVQPATGDAKRPPAKHADGTIVTLEDASATGGDISVASQKGSLTFAQGAGIKEARLNIHLAVKPEDSFYNKEVEDPSTPGKTTQPNKRIKTAIELGLKNKLTDGQIGVAIMGTVGEPKVTTEKPRTRVTSSGASTGSSRKMNIDHPSGEEGGEGEGGDDKAKSRPTKPERSDKPDTESRVNTRRSPPVVGKQTTPVRPATMERPRPVIPVDTTPPPEPMHATEPPPTEPVPEPAIDPNAPPVEGQPSEDPALDPNAPPAEEPQPQ